MKALALFLVFSVLAFAKVVPTYFVAKASTVGAVKSNLQGVGFQVLSTYKLDGSHTVITVTNSELKNSNTFVAAINVLVNSSKEVKVQNPNYYGLAYGVGEFPSTVSNLANALGALRGSKESLDSSKLPKYHFMFGMPYFNEQIVVAKGVTAPKKPVVYKLTLPNGSVLVGHKLSPSNRLFLKKINSMDNAALLPYQSIIVGGNAKIMNAKYYLAVSLPDLKMGDFMKISDVPGKIENDIASDYK